mmetsp:Transcript_3731/g.9635  ORF Transcript_3731/g.9635 Transcript_3731/m.9635 type:complete len:256 (-) Transcript_3731:595-1362(-)
MQRQVVGWRSVRSTRTFDEGRVRVQRYAVAAGRQNCKPLEFSKLHCVPQPSGFVEHAIAGFVQRHTGVRRLCRVLDTQSEERCEARRRARAWPSVGGLQPAFPDAGDSGLDFLAGSARRGRQQPARQGRKGACREGLSCLHFCEAAFSERRRFLPRARRYRWALHAGVLLEGSGARGFLPQGARAVGRPFVRNEGRGRVRRGRVRGNGGREGLVKSLPAGLGEAVPAVRSRGRSPEGALAARVFGEVRAGALVHI